MPYKTGILRFEANGPNGQGLSRMDLDPKDFQTLPSEQNVHVYFEDKDLGMSAGVWDTTSMQEAFGPYPGDEFIVVLEGHFTMEDGKGESVPAQKGQSVIFRNAVPVSWRQVGYLKKFYITYMDPHAETPKIESADNGILAVDPEMALNASDQVDGARAKQHDRVLFTNDHGNMTVGLWDSAAWTTEMEPFPNHEFVQVLEGDVTITEDNGTVHDFTAGDVFFIPQGTMCSWDVSRYVRKFYAAIDRNIRPREA